MKRIHGRKNQPLEFVEFQCERKGRKASFIAQRSGDLWHTYYNEPGPKAPCRIIKLNFKTLSEAEAFAKQQADRWGRGEQIQFDKLNPQTNRASATEQERRLCYYE